MSEPADFSGIRVWRGYRAQSFMDDPNGFYQKLGQIFVPQTVQQMTPLGLQAYYPAVLQCPVGDPLPLPDEIALVIYPSKQTYTDATKKTVAGRAYGALHSTVFNFDGGDIPKSTSSAPLPWPAGKGLWQWGEAYHLLNREVIWHHCTMELMVARPLPEFAEAIGWAVERWQCEHSAHISGSIMAVDSHQIIYWEAHEGNSIEHSFIPFLKECCHKPLLESKAKKLLVDPIFTFPAAEIELAPGDFLDVRLKV